MLLLIALFLIILEAVPEALALKGHKIIAGAIEFVYRAFVTLVIYMWAMGVSHLNYGHNFYYAVGGISYYDLQYLIFYIIWLLDYQ